MWDELKADFWKLIYTPYTCVGTTHLKINDKNLENFDILFDKLLSLYDNIYKIHSYKKHNKIES